MKKIEKLEKFIGEAEGFIGQNITYEDSKFVAWNNSLLRFIKESYDVDTYNVFHNRQYCFSAWPVDTPHSRFVKVFEQDMNTTIEDLKRLLEDELDKEPESDNSAVKVESEMDYVSIIKNIFDRFHMVCRQLRNRYESRETLDVSDEYDVQDLLHALLRIYFDDIRPEEWTPSYAGGCSRVDFLLKKEKIIIEVKKTRKGLQDKQLGEQLIVDIARYKSHPDCKTLLCFIYDPDERVANPRGLESDLTKNTDGLNVITVVTQK